MEVAKAVYIFYHHLKEPEWELKTMYEVQETKSLILFQPCKNFWFRYFNIPLSREAQIAMTVLLVAFYR